jgi:hypothetical protein
MPTAIRLLTLAALVLVATVARADSYVMSSSDVINTKSRPIMAAEEKTYGQAVTTTTVNLIGPAATNADVSWTQETTQNFRVVNTHASNFLCVRTIARASAADSCESTCSGLGAGVITCTGSGAADGTLIPAGGILTPAITGLDCLCGEASAASTNVNTTRVARVAQ